MNSFARVRPRWRRGRINAPPQTPQGPAHPRRGIRSFTLIELMAVVVIISMLIVSATVMFRGIFQSAGTKGAIASLRSTLALARQHAITHRDTVYVVFVSDVKGAFNGANRVHMDKALRAYNVYSMNEKSYLRDWIYLPPGLIFDTQYKPTKNVFGQGKIIARINNTTQDPPPWGEWPSIMFRPTGQMLEAMQVDPEVYIRDGFLPMNTNNGTFGDPVTNKNQGTIWGLQVYRLTGQARVQEVDPRK